MQKRSMQDVSKLKLQQTGEKGASGGMRNKIFENLIFKNKERLHFVIKFLLKYDIKNDFVNNNR